MKKTSMGVLAAACVSMTAAGTALAQSATSRYPITTEQRTTADQVAQAGVPLAALAPDAPELYTVKSGDTLWDLSRMYLTSPWRWPELWGMNKQQIANPHLIYPGQQLQLVKENGRARLEIAGAGAGGASTRRQAAAVDPRPRCGAGGDPQHSDESDSAVPVATAGARPDRAERCAAHRRHAGRPRLHRAW